MDQLRPPEGCKFDMAIGTTFSLDLFSLLIAPLSLVLFEYEDKDEALKDPTALLEALRLTADKITVFCQAGRIAVPTTDNYLFHYLEPMVVQVKPENPEGVFHPKIWVLRYTAADKEIHYRFLCLSRNLTFDCSWDTILTLDGVYDQERTLAFSRNRPLSDFILKLPELARNVSITTKKNIKRIADEVLRVRFEPPEQFDEINFIPIGIDGYKKGPSFKDTSRLLVISPFLSGKKIETSFAAGQKNVLISRPESLDGVEPELLKNLSKTTNLYIMESNAEKPQGDEAEKAVAQELSLDEDLSGLHAKLYVSEEGWDARFLTGSANVTTKGLDGVNVEFLTELTGKKSLVGIDKILNNDTSEITLFSLLVPYKIPEQKTSIDENRKALENALEANRKRLIHADLKLRVITENGNQSLELTSQSEIAFEGNTQVFCWPIMLPDSHAKNLLPLTKGERVVFSGLSLLGLTSFLAFRINSKVNTLEGNITFTMNIPVADMPEERSIKILQHMIGNSERFIRFLLFLLADNPEDLLIEQLIQSPRESGKQRDSWSNASLPLLEEMVRAFSRNPEKIQRISSLVKDLKKTEGGNRLLPTGFDEIWGAFQAAMDTGKNNGN